MLARRDARVDARGLLARLLVQHGQIGADLRIDRIHVGQRGIGHLTCGKAARIHVARNLRGASFDQRIGHGVPLFGDDPRHAEEPARSLRRLR